MSTGWRALFFCVFRINDRGREASGVKQGVKLLDFVRVNRQFGAVGDCSFCNLFISVGFREAAGGEKPYVVRDNAVCAGINLTF